MPPGTLSDLLPHTVNQLVALQRAEAPDGRAAVGARPLRVGIARGEFGAKLGNRYLATPAELRAWLESKRVPPLSDESGERARAAARARVAERVGIGGPGG